MTVGQWFSYIRAIYQCCCSIKIHCCTSDFYRCIDKTEQIPFTVGSNYASWRQRIRVIDKVPNKSVQITVAIMRYKKTTARLKNPSRFQSYKDKDRFEEFLEPINILKEKGFIFPTQPTGVMSSIHTAVVGDDG